VTADVDSVLVEAARAGSAEAFSELVDRYRAPIVRLAYRLTRDPDEAKDIAQDAFLRAYRRLGEFRPDRPFARWLFVIARNASLDAGSCSSIRAIRAPKNRAPRNSPY
jgi:RNA polymerase sigma-70 factor (ECF subfamily)